MVVERTQRRLAAILAADVVGYSRLMEAEEEGTLRRLQGDLRELVTPTIEAHYGRLVKTTGDGLLAEFASVVDAVRCAVAVQRGEEERNSGLPKDRRVLFRIGINLGDVIVENGDLYGDGVNVAARLESMAEPGGVLLSGTAYDQLKKNVDVGFEYLGHQQVKNIDAPVRVYRVLTDPDTVGKTISTAKQRPRLWFVLAALLAVVAGGAVLAWWRPWEPKLEPASVERMALPLPDKPSIVVLPFANMSGDPQQEYFADGITENLTTDLSSVAGLFVIARNTAFTYKGKTMASARVAEELGVRYLVEGSVQRAGDTVRINAQLIDAVSGGHVWADRFDGSLADIFALQDRVTGAVVNALEVRLTAGEQQVLGQRDTNVPAAYDAFLQGWGHFRRITPEDFVKAVPYFEQAISLDPHYGRAHAALGLVYYFAYERGWWSNLGITQHEAYNRAQEQQQQASKYPTSTYYQAQGNYARNVGEAYIAIGFFKKAIALDPSDSWSYAYLAWAEIDTGQAGDAAAHIATAIRLDPHYPPEFIHILGLAQLGIGQYADAAATLEQAAKLNPDNEHSLLALAAAYGHLGRTIEAAAAVAAYDKIRVNRGGMPLTIDTTPSPTFSRYTPNLLFKQGLRKAGVPEYFEGSEFAARNRQNGEEIRALLLGHRLHGRHLDSGDTHQADIAVDGSVTLSGDWGSFTNGTIRFDGDAACILEAGNKRICFTVLRNPGGSVATENEYIWIDGTGAYSFSQVK